MDADLPYLMSSKRFPELLDKIQSAAVPERVTFEFLKKLGFASSNDRAYPSLLKRLGFLDQNGVPSERYKEYRHRKQARQVLAAGVREAYAELFNVHETIYKEDRESIKGVVNRVTGREQRYVDLITATFMVLCESADFEPIKVPEIEKKPASQKSEPNDDASGNGSVAEKNSSTAQRSLGAREPKDMSFHYNIEIHLPATTDISVYNAIFKSLRQNLGD